MSSAMAFLRAHFDLNLNAALCYFCALELIVIMCLCPL